MSVNKPGIPPIPEKADARDRFDRAVKESLEVIMGRRKSRVAPLDPVVATAEDCARKINELLGVLQ